MRDSDELASAFVELEALVRDSSRLPGLAAAQVEARRRRANRAAWVASALVVLVVAGVAVAVPGWLRLNGPPVLEPSPSVTTGPTPSPSGTISPPSAVLADLLPPEWLQDATLEVPAGDAPECPSGRLEFLSAVHVSPGFSDITIRTVDVGDVNGDGRDDSVVALVCAIPNGLHTRNYTMVVAYSGPELALLSQVGEYERGGVARLVVTPEGAIDVDVEEVNDLGRLSGPGWRDSYTWTGSAFETVGRVDFDEEPTMNLSITVNPTAIELAPGGPPQTVLVTVYNHGAAPSLPLRLNTTSGTAGVTVDADGFPGLPGRPDRRLLIPSPEADQAVTVALHISVPAGASLQSGSTVTVSVYGPSNTGNYVTPPIATISLVPA